MRCTRFGALEADNGSVGHQLVLIEADSVSDLADGPALPSQHFLCFVVWDAPSDVEPVRSLARTLLDAGAVFVSAFGRDCERVHDAIDEVMVTTERERGDDDVIMPTWHDYESLEEPLWFGLFTALMLQIDVREIRVRQIRSSQLRSA